jgi:hypothetical protein
LFTPEVNPIIQGGPIPMDADLKILILRFFKSVFFMVPKREDPKVINLQCADNPEHVFRMNAKRRSRSTFAKLG